jgi:isopenicillin N synthase-like dioxygenase
MPPGHQATVGHLKTFALPEAVTGSPSDRKLGKEMIESWREDGIFQISMSSKQEDVLKHAYVKSQDFFKQPHDSKARHVDSQSFAGYIASGEELTDGIADYSEIFTVTKDLAETDPRVQAKWPCHGPCPWPNQDYKEVMGSVMSSLGEHGEKLLKLVALGLGLEKDTLTQLTDDGWHHMRILRFVLLAPAMQLATEANQQYSFPKAGQENGKGKAGRGIGSHTDYGLLVIASQDHVGGLFIRPPIQGETIKNWEKSAAGLNEGDDKWVYVPPVPGVFTCFPGRSATTSRSMHKRQIKLTINRRHDAIPHELLPPLNSTQSWPQHSRALHIRLFPRAEFLRRCETHSWI